MLFPSPTYTTCAGETGAHILAGWHLVNGMLPARHLALTVASCQNLTNRAMYACTPQPPTLRPSKRPFFSMAVSTSAMIWQGWL
jgi:hypothetical protein